MRKRQWLIGCGVMWAAGCGMAVPPVAAPFRVVGTNIDDGGVVAPTATLTVRLSQPPDDPVESALALVQGTPDLALLRALETPPLAAREQAPLVPVQVATEDLELRITPRRPLEPHARYSLVVGGGLAAGGVHLGEALIRPFQTGDVAAGAPSVTLRDPEEGASSVPPNLRAVEFQVSEPVSGQEAFELVDEAGARAPGRVEPGQCLGCLRLVLEGELQAARRYQLRAGPSVQNARGEPIFGDPPVFMTAGMVRTASATLRRVDVQGADGCLVARFDSDEPTSAQLCVADRCRFDGPARSHALPIPLGSTGSVPYELTIWDESTLPPQVVSGAVEVSPVALALTEVLTRPLGSHLAEQFVELYNRGMAPIDLGGLSLYSGDGRVPLGGGRLPAGGYALLVTRNFQLDDGADPPVAAGALLLRTDSGRLVGSGLRATGEPLWVEDQAGRVVTRWGGYPLDLAPGQSVSRVSPAACDLAASFEPTRSGRSTPGSG